MKERVAQEPLREVRCWLLWVKCSQSDFREDMSQLLTPHSLGHSSHRPHRTQGCGQHGKARHLSFQGTSHGGFRKLVEIA